MKSLKCVLRSSIVFLLAFLSVLTIEIKYVNAFDNGSSLYEVERYDYRTRRYVNVDFNGGTGLLSYAVQVDRTAKGNVVEGMWIEGLGIGTLVKDVQNEYHYLRAWSNNQSPKEGRFYMEIDSIGVTPYLVFSNLKRTGYTYNGILTRLSNGKQYLGFIQSYKGNPACGIGAMSTGWTMAKKSGNALKEWLKDNPDLYFEVLWKANTYTIQYDGNGETGGSMDMSTYTYDVEGVLSKNKFYKEGYEFVGWATQRDGDIEFVDMETILNLSEENNKTIKLYAKWVPSRFSVSNYKIYSRFIGIQECADGTVPLNCLSAQSIWNTQEYFSILSESLYKTKDDYLIEYEYINQNTYIDRFKKGY